MKILKFGNIHIQEKDQKIDITFNDFDITYVGYMNEIEIAQQVLNHVTDRILQERGSTLNSYDSYDFDRANNLQEILDETEKRLADSKKSDDDWIKCSDKLPAEHDHEIWLFNGNVHTGYALCNGKFLDWNEQCVELENVTHWMPIRVPNAPGGIVEDGE